MKWFILLMSMIFSSFLSANECQEKAWPYSRTIQSKKLLHEIFVRESRSNLIAYTFYELFHENKQNLALPLLFFLGQTEQEDTVRQFYKGIGHLALNRESTLLHAMEKWPQHNSIPNFSSKKQLVCGLYDKALASVYGGSQ